MIIGFYNQLKITIMKLQFITLRGFILLFLFICFFASCNNYDSGNNAITSIEEYRELRSEKLNKPRNLIHNNDGCDVIYFPVNEKYSVKNLMDKRSAGLIGSGVSTISFCPTSSGFGY